MDLILVPTAREAALLLPEANPTPAGWRYAKRPVALTGVGLATSGIHALKAVLGHRPARCILVGIAGSYDLERLPIGAAFVPSFVAVHGIGAGEGNAHLSTLEMGLAMEPDEKPDRQATGSDRASTSLGSSRCEHRRLAPDAGHGGLLLSVAAAAASPSERDARRSRYPDALAEDMEAFAVAVACASAGVPLTVVRGVSNECGDRDHAAWRIGEAIAAARRTLDELLQADGA